MLGHTTQQILGSIAYTDDQFECLFFFLLHLLYRQNDANNFIIAQVLMLKFG